MIYKSLEECVIDLEKHGHLIRVKEEVDPNLEMSAIHLHLFQKGGPAVLFEKVKGTSYRAVSNLFGTLERSHFMFRSRFAQMQQMVQLRNNPLSAIKQPLKYFSTGLAAFSAIPKRASLSSAGFKEIRIEDLPLIKHWPKDGGAFVTLPQVYSEDCDKPGVMASNLGMYRIQLNGNNYQLNQEIGLHYQLHRGIGVHQTKTNKKGESLKVSVFVGGPPSHTLAAVMPLPEGISELTFAGALGGKRFRYAYEDGYCISLDADFVITGEVLPNNNKPEGPFGDHLGYYSLQHEFPVMKVHKVYAKENAIWPFTVVGRPPQEDTAFGALIHDISGSAIPNEIPGVKEIHAVDAAGVHPLLLAVGSERYTPYLQINRPSELLTQANHILGTGQLSLAKYLFIASSNQTNFNCHNVGEFFTYVFERIDLKRDLHFYTKTSIDTLDYSGDGLNEGSKLVVAACDNKLRDLNTSLPNCLLNDVNYTQPVVIMPGVIGLQVGNFTSYNDAKTQMHNLSVWIKKHKEEFEGIVQIVVYNDFNFDTGNNQLNDYVWVTYTRSNPAKDIYGVNEFIEDKHWGCDIMIMDARKKPHHAPELVMDEKVLVNIQRFFEKGASLEKWK